MWSIDPASIAIGAHMTKGLPQNIL